MPGLACPALSARAAWQTFRHINNNATGALVAGVYRDSPAAQAGVRPGDLLLGLDAHAFARARDAAAVLAGLRRDQDVRLRLLRHGRQVETRATAIRQPDYARR